MQDDSRSDRPAGGRRQRRPKAPLTLDLPAQPARRAPPAAEPSPEQPERDEPVRDAAAAAEGEVQSPLESTGAATAPDLESSSESAPTAPETAAGSPSQGAAESSPDATPQPEAERQFAFDAPDEPVASPEAAETPAESVPEAFIRPPNVMTEEVAEPPPAAPPTPPIAASPASAPPRPGGFGMVAAGIVGGLVVLVIGLLFSVTGLLPSAGRDAADRAAAEASSATSALATLDRRVAQLEATTTGADVKTLAGEVASLQAAVQQFGSRVDALAKAPPVAVPSGPASEVRVPAERLAELQGNIVALAARVAQLETAAAPSGSAPPSDLPDRVARVEAAVSDLSAKLADLAARPANPATDSERAARAVAIGTLRQAAGKSGPFADDLAMLQVLGSDPADVAALKPLAEKGAPSAADLTGAFPAVADAILSASNAPGPDADFFDRVAGFARGLVTVRPTTAIPGETPEAIVSRMQAAVDAGDLKRALAEREHLPDAGKDASAAWAAGAETRIAIDGLVARLTRSLAPNGG